MEYLFFIKIKIISGNITVLKKYGKKKKEFT
jgi:hypothetical protein